MQIFHSKNFALRKLGVFFESLSVRAMAKLDSKKLKLLSMYIGRHFVMA